MPVYLDITWIDEKSSAVNSGSSSKSWIIGYTSLYENTDWSSLDRATLKLFNNYLTAVDPEFHLGIDDKCLSHYRIGSVTRSLHETIAQHQALQPLAALSESEEHKLMLSINTDSGSLASLVLDTLVPLQEISR